MGAQERRGHALGSFKRRPVPDILQRAHGGAGQALADALGHVRAGDRVQHAPHERERHVRLLQRPHPTIAVPFAVAYVADQKVGDAQGYRSKEELEAVKCRDCFTGYRQRLIADSALTEAEAEKMVEDARGEVDQAIAYAKSCPYPRPESALEHVFAE